MKLQSDDLFQTPLDQPEIDFENAGGETYVCGNPPYKGGTEQDVAQKSDLENIFGGTTNTWKSLDYVSGWFLKFARYAQNTGASCAFVSTNSITQGEQVARLWPLVLSSGLAIRFAYTSFKWQNLASHNAAVIVAIIGVGPKGMGSAKLFSTAGDDEIKAREVPNINAYLVPYEDVVVEPRSKPSFSISHMTNGNKAVDGGHLILSPSEARVMRDNDPCCEPFIKRLVGSFEAIQGAIRYCLWIPATRAAEALNCVPVAQRVALVAEMRKKSKKALTVATAKTPYAFQQVRQKGTEVCIVVPAVSSETREYLPVCLLPAGTIVTHAAFGLFDAPLWNMAFIASRLHLVWIATVCGKLKTDFRYSNTLGWNTFPVPRLTEQNKADLTSCAEDILLAREAHYPSSIGDLYDPETMPENVRSAHEANDEVMERIYIGRRFRNDTERLEKLFEMYTKMTVTPRSSTKPAAKRARRATA